MRKQFLTLAVLLLLSSVYGCGSQTDALTTGDVSAADTEPDATVSDAADFVPRDIFYPDEEFVVLHASGYGYSSAGYEGSEYNEIAPLAEEVAVGDIINEAVLKRNQMTEEKLGVQITAIESSYGCFEFNQDIERSVLAGDNAYDAVCGTMTTMYKCAVQNLLYNLADISSLDLSHSWWDQKISTLCNFGTTEDIIYFANGDINYLDNYASHMLYFNKSMMGRLSIDLPYDLVREHKWTYDALYNMIRNVYQDLDNDGKVSFDDQFGLVTNISALERFVPCSDISLVNLDENGNCTPNLSDRVFTVVDKYFDLLAENQNVWLDDGGAYAKIFLRGDSLFTEDYLCFFAGDCKDMEDDYGAVPFPLFDESQEQYYAPVNMMYGTSIGVITNADVTLAGYVLDVMAAYSVDTVTNAVIETNCKIKAIRDEDTIDMLEIAFAGVLNPLHTITAWGKIDQQIFIPMLSTQNNNFASRIEKFEKIIIKDSEKDLNALRMTQ